MFIVEQLLVFTMSRSTTYLEFTENGEEQTMNICIIQINNESGVFVSRKHLTICDSK